MARETLSTFTYMILTEQEKCFLIDELDDYFEKAEVHSETPLISEKIVEILEAVLSDDTIEDQEFETRKRIGNFIWDNQICYGVDCYSLCEELNLQGKRYSYHKDDVINAGEVMRVLKRLEDEEFEIGTATQSEKQFALENARELSRNTNLNELKEKTKPFVLDEHFGEEL